MEPVDCLFLDPARRDSHGGMKVDIAAFESYVCSLETGLVDQVSMVMT